MHYHNYGNLMKQSMSWFRPLTVTKTKFVLLGENQNQILIPESPVQYTNNEKLENWRNYHKVNQKVQFSEQIGNVFLSIRNI